MISPKSSQKQLSPKQAEIVTEIRTAILDILAHSGKKPGAVVQVASLYQFLADHYKAPVKKIIELGNQMIWAALALLQLQGWIKIDSTRPRIKVIRELEMTDVPQNFEVLEFAS